MNEHWDSDICVRSYNEHKCAQCWVCHCSAQSKPSRSWNTGSSPRNTADSANLPGTDPICTRSNYLCTSSYPCKHLLKSAALHLLPQIRSGPSEHFLSCLVFFLFFLSSFPLLSLHSAPPTFPSSLLSNTHTHTHPSLSLHRRLGKALDGIY